MNQTRSLLTPGPWTSSLLNCELMAAQTSSTRAPQRPPCMLFPSSGPT